MVRFVAMSGQTVAVLRLRAARAEELDALSALCLRSKAVWGYEKDFINACRAELTLTPADLTTSRAQVAERDGKRLGVAHISATNGVAHLEKLFVEPDLLRAGVGRCLFAWAIAAAREAGARALIVESDPGAAEFYRRMGARDDASRRQAPSPDALSRVSDSPWRETRHELSMSPRDGRRLTRVTSLRRIP
jgi:N-acetylglutamate synthase-like GNAT family acetyltransferase